MRAPWVILLGACLLWIRPALADDPQMTVRSLVETEDPLKDRLVRGWLADVRKEPVRFIPILLGYLDLKTIATATDFEVARLARNAGAVLVHACGEEGRVAVANRVIEVQAERDKLREQLTLDSPEATMDKNRIRKMEYRLRHLEESLIDVFTQAKDNRLCDAVLGRFERRDFDAHPVYLEYLEANCRGDETLKSRLKPLLDDSPLRDNPKLKSLLKTGPKK